MRANAVRPFDFAPIRIEDTRQKIMRKVILYPGEDGYIVAECPSLPGCISQGKTRTQALENIREAISLYIKTLVEDGELVPEERVEMVEV